MQVSRQTAAAFIAWMGMACLVAGMPSVTNAGDPMEEINKRFQQRKEAGETALLDVQQQYQAQRAAMEMQWKQREQAIAARWRSEERRVGKECRL